MTPGPPATAPGAGDEFAPPADLARSSARSGATTLGAQAVQLAVGTASGIALARLLGPRAFGLYAMVYAVADAAAAVRDFGFPMAVVAAERPTRDQLTALWWHHVRLNGLVSLGMVTLAPALAAFYGEPLLVPIALSVEVGSLAVAVTALHLALLRRRLAFGAVARVEVGAVLVSSVAAVVAAVAGAGVWALVIQHVVLGFLRGAGFLAASRWWPGPPVRGGADIGALRRYGARRRGVASRRTSRAASTGSSLGGSRARPAWGCTPTPPAGRCCPCSRCTCRC